MWKTRAPEPQPESSVLECENVRLSVGEARNDPRKWKYFSMSFGVHTNQPQSDCLKTWPREALQLARQELDRFEARLDEEG